MTATLDAVTSKKKDKQEPSADRAQAAAAADRAAIECRHLAKRALHERHVEHFPRGAREQRVLTSRRAGWSS